jgi:hypothetical protein
LTNFIRAQKRDPNSDCPSENGLNRNDSIEKLKKTVGQTTWLHPLVDEKYSSSRLFTTEKDLHCRQGLL